MMRRMSEMVEPSKEGKILPLLKEQHSKVYDDELDRRYGSTMRINLPFEYGKKLGLGSDCTFARIYMVDDTICISSNRLDYEMETFSPIFFHKYNGDPRSDILHDMIDEVFFILPNGFYGFNVDDDVVFEYVREVPDGMERHVVMKHAKD
jgi:hypothetical protein